MALSPDEVAQLQAMGWAPPGPAVGPANPPPAAPPAPAGSVQGPPSPAPPLAMASAAPDAGPALPPPQAPAAVSGPTTPTLADLTPAPGATNAHAPPGLRAPVKSGVGADQTVSYSGPPPSGTGGAPAVTPPTPQTSSSFTRTVQQGVPLSKETKALEDDAARKITQGQSEEERALAAKQEASHRASFVSNALAQQAAREQQADVNLMQAELAPKRAAIDAGLADLATRKVDPEHFYASRGTFGRIAMALGSIGGAFAANYKTGGGQNFAAEMIKNAVDNDIKSQEANAENARGAVQGQITAYGLARQSFQDRNEQRQAARVLALGAAQQQISDAAAATNDPLERAHMLQVHGQVGQQLADERAKLDELVAGKVTTSSHTTVTSGGTVGQGGVPTDRIARGPDGKMYLFGDAKDAQEVQKAQAAAQAIARDVARVKALRQAGGQFPVGETRAQLDAAVGDLRGHWMDLHQKRMPPDLLKEQADQMIGDPSSMWDWHAPARLDALLQSVNGTVSSDLSAYGATPLDPGNIATRGDRVVYQTPTVPNLPTGKGGK